MMTALGVPLSADGQPHPTDIGKFGLESIDKAAQPRALKAIDADNEPHPVPRMTPAASRTCGPIDVPRFLGALTDIDGQEDVKTVPLNTLVAMRAGSRSEARARSQRCRPATRSGRPSPRGCGWAARTTSPTATTGSAVAWLNGENTAPTELGNSRTCRLA